MTTKHVIVLGAGAAGTAAARALEARDEVHVTWVTRTGETPYTRMHIKGVAFGPTPPQMITLPLPDVEVLDDTVVEVDANSRTVRTTSGADRTYDALIVATGSTARPLLPGQEHRPSPRVGPLHSLEDALRIRDFLAGHAHPAKIAIYGGGITAAEAASALHSDGHAVILIARSTVPGVAAFGAPVAERLSAEHQARLTTHFGRTIRDVETTDTLVSMVLDDGSTLEADFLLFALGTTPSGPAPWAGAVTVDDRLRAGADHVYAAGGVAVHHDENLGTWRIDHWEDAATQGGHAARSALHGLGLAEDPGPYRPRSAYVAMIHGLMVSGVGTTDGARAEQRDGEEFVTVHIKNGTPVGASGVDAVGTVYGWGQRLHEAQG